MAVTKKAFCGLTARCFGAAAIGMSFVAIITFGLLVMSADSEDTPASRMAQYTLKFPEDEQMLKDLSAQILKDSSLADPEHRALQDMEPAAGDPKTTPGE